MTAVWKIWFELPRAFAPTDLGQKMLFWTDFELWPNISLQQNMISTIEKKLVNIQGLSICFPNLMNFAVETAQNSYQVFAHPLSIHILGDTASLTASTLYNRQQENFGLWYVVAWAYSLEQQNAGRAHAGLCHASSYLLSLNTKALYVWLWHLFLILNY